VGLRENCHPKTCHPEARVLCGPKDLNLLDSRPGATYAESFILTRPSEQSTIPSMKPLQGLTSLILLTASLLAASASAQNPVPQIVGPVHPDAVAPGGGDFTLSVYGANFVPGAVVNWNYQPRATTYVSGHELQAQILSTDIAKNTAGYITVTNPAPGGGSSSASWAQVEVHAPISTVALRQPTFYTFGAWTLGTADFTHSGILDLVGQSSGLSFDLGTGNGTFRSGSVINGNFAQTTQFVYGDFNGDGSLDVAFDLGQIGSITQMAVMFGDGKGSFTPGMVLTEREGLGQPIAGDFNQDGKLDLITTGGELLLEFLGNGDGTFRKPIVYFYGFLGPVMQVGDFNGDGKLDVLLMGPAVDNGNKWSIWYMQGNGDGTFQPPKEIISLQDTNGCGFTGEEQLRVTDFNGDGKLDVAFCVKKGIGIMLGNGDGTFQAPSYYLIDPTASGQFTFAVGDITSNGIQDLIASVYTDSTKPQLAVYMGNGDGTFKSPQMRSVISQAQLGVTVGDFDSDGLLDFIYCFDGGMDVFLQQ